MPYMKVSLAQKLTEEQRDEVAKELGIALEQVPGKERTMLMLDLEDGKLIYMGGVRQEQFALIDARYYSNFEYHIRKNFTKAVFAALNKTLDIPFHKMSMNLFECNDWGAFGNYVDERYADPEET